MIGKVKHGFVLGNIEKGNITYQFVNVECTDFKTINVDISDARIISDVLEKIEIGKDIYRICLKGVKNIETMEVSKLILEKYNNVCEVKDETKLPYDLEKIALSSDLKGVFTKKMLEYLKNHPSEEEAVMKAIEITYNAL